MFHVSILRDTAIRKNLWSQNSQSSMKIFWLIKSKQKEGKVLVKATLFGKVKRFFNLKRFMPTVIKYIVMGCVDSWTNHQGNFLAFLSTEISIIHEKCLFENILVLLIKQRKKFISRHNNLPNEYPCFLAFYGNHSIFSMQNRERAFICSSLNVPFLP